MNKKSALKHTGDGHMLLNEEAHKEAHGGQSPDQQQPSQPDWLRDIDTVKGLKVPSYNKLKEDEVRKIYREMKAAGYNVKAITATLDAINKKDIMLTSQVFLVIIKNGKNITSQKTNY